MSALLARLRATPLTVAFCLLLVRPSCAAISTLGDVTPDPNTTTSSDDLYVGDTSAGMMLVDAGSDVRSRSSYVGDDVGAVGSVMIDGGGSTWANRRDLTVGNNGTGILGIMGGGQVSNVAAYLGKNPGSSGSAIVDGANSTWTNTDLLIGDEGTGALEITDGGYVYNNDGFLGRSSDSIGTAAVDGIGSTWTSHVALYVGYSGDGILDVTGRGYVDDFEGYVGYEFGSRGMVTVAGTGSTWKNIDGLCVGYSGDGTLNITGGGRASSGEGTLGYGIGSVGTVTVDGAGSTWKNDYDLNVGYSGDGTLNITGGGEVKNRLAFLGRSAGSTGTATVDGFGSTWSNGSLAVGEQGDGRLYITDGGYVRNDAGYLGRSAGSTGTATVDGTDSTWTSNFLAVGEEGGGTLDITGGGHVMSVHGFLGRSAGSTGTVTVDGDGSTMDTSPDDLNVGYGGTGTLNITGKAHVSSNDASLGYETGSAGAVTVDGAGSIWTNDQDLYVGYGGTGVLSVTNGGTVISGDAQAPYSVCYLGHSAQSMGVATVEGTGSTWTVNSSLYVGYKGVGTMNIAGGGHVTNDSASLGGVDGSAGTVRVDGAGSTWTINGDLGVPNRGRLSVSGGGQVVNRMANIGGELDDPQPGVVTVDGAGSTWTSTQYVRLGFAGDGTLSITNGATVVTNSTKLAASVGAYLGYFAGASGEATVHGEGSTWTNYGRLCVGYNGSGTLNIVGGGLVDVKGDTSVGSFGARRSGSVFFDAGTLRTDSLWAAATDLKGTGTIDTRGLVTDVDLFFDQDHALQQQVSLNSEPGQNITVNIDVDGTQPLGVGFAAGGSLTIADGIYLQSTYGYLGYLAGSTGTATVEGPGSAWRAAATYVGFNGSATLHITGGGHVDSYAGRVGHKVGSSGTVSVDGPGSTWAIGNDGLDVGNGGQGILVITGGTVTVDEDMTLGYQDTGAGTVNLMDGVLQLRGGTLSKGEGSATFSFTGGRLEGVGTIDFGVPLVQNGGTLAPGNSAGTTTIEGGYALDGGAIEIEINGLGTAGTDWDLVDVNGAVDLVGTNGLLDGTLDVILNFAPSLGDEFLILGNDGTDAIVGMFATGPVVKAPYDGGLYQFAIDYAAGDGNDISLISQGEVGLVGDYNGDGTVDAADYTVWRDALGTTVARYFGADGDGDGTVNHADHEVWKANFGHLAAGSGLGAAGVVDDPARFNPQSAIRNPQSAAVPEPASLALLLLAGAALVVRCRSVSQNSPPL